MIDGTVLAQEMDVCVTPWHVDSAAGRRKVWRLSNDLRRVRRWSSSARALVGPFRNINFTNSKNFGVAADRNASVTLPAPPLQKKNQKTNQNNGKINAKKINKSKKKKINTIKKEKKKKIIKKINARKKEEASKGYHASRRLNKMFFLKKLQDIVQQLRPKKSYFEHPRQEKEKKRKKNETLNPQGRTPPFRRLTCCFIVLQDSGVVT